MATITAIAAPTSGSTSSRGSGEARIEGSKLRLGPGTLLLIERGEKHEIRNTGDEVLKTLNFYVPPAYTKAGNEKSAGKS